METLDTLCGLAADTLNVSDEALLRAGTLRDAGIDSLAALDLVFAVEAHYGITLPAGDLQTVRSLADLAAIVDRHTAGAPPGHGA